MSILSTPHPNRIGRYLRAGLIAGTVAVVVNIIIYVVLMALNGSSTEAIVFGSIVIASLLPNLLAATVYFGLNHFAPRPRLILTIGVIIFVLISVLPHLGIGPAPSSALSALPEGFDIITVPLHIIFGLTAITIMPTMAKGDSQS